MPEASAGICYGDDKLVKPLIFLLFVASTTIWEFLSGSNPAVHLTLDDWLLRSLHRTRG